MNNNIKINLPKNCKIVIWKKNYDYNYNIWLIHESKKFKINTNIKNIEFDKWNNCLLINLKNYYNTISKTEKKINNFFKSWNLFFFKKIKFKGKGFRIKFFKKIKLIKFYFGKSHKTFLFLKKIKNKKINKYKFIISSLIKTKTNYVWFLINKIKKLNVFTLRGLRLSKQIIYKRKGKKGTYI